MMAQEGKHAQIKIEGRGTFEIAGAFKQAYQQLLGRGAKEFIIDLSLCETLDSTFLGILIGCGLRVKEASGILRIIEATKEIVALFREVGLDRLFDIDEAQSG
jgi:anti-sigma B factor antagonist